MAIPGKQVPSDKESVLIEQALAELRARKTASRQAGQEPTRSGGPDAGRRGQVQRPAQPTPTSGALRPDAAARIAIAMEQEALEKEAERAKQRRLVMLLGGGLIAFALLAFVASGWFSPATKSGSAPGQATRGAPAR